MLENLGAWFASMTGAQVSWAFAFLTLALALEVSALVRALTRSYGVQGTIMWVVVILLVPVGGALAFYLLVAPSVRRVALKRRRASAQLRRESAARGGGGGAPERDAKASESDALVDLATALTDLPPTAGNEVELLTDEAPTFRIMEQAIGAARRQVWAEYYIIRNDLSGRRFLQLLIERARAGVEVRLLYDAVGSAWINGRLVKELVAAGGEAHKFLPMNFLRRRFAIHLRNHRKLIVIDGESGFVGGMNIGNEYFRRRHRGRRADLQPYHDSQLRLRGPCVESLARTFSEDWHFAAGEVLPPPAKVATPPPPPTPTLPPEHADAASARDGSIVAVIPSGPDQEFNASALAYFSAIASARRRVYLTTPYFIPDDAAISALVGSALRRVDVRVMVPHRSNERIAEMAARWYYGKMLRGGVRIFEYEPAMLHAKTLVIDGAVAMVGSANADIRSWRLNFELGALIADPRFARHLEERFVRDLADSREVTLEQVARQDWRARFAHGVARLLSPML
jgi:cardiolipin synthase